MKLAFIAKRNKEKIEVILNQNSIFHGKEKSYPSSVQARKEFEKLKRLYKKRKYVIRTVFSAVEQDRLIKKQKERVKGKETTLSKETIMGIRARLGEDESDEKK